MLEGRSAPISPMQSTGHKQIILGVSFFDGTEAEALARARNGGLIVAPSGPGLADDLRIDPAYRAAVTTADLALPDSGFMVLIWNLLGCTGGRRKMKRFSGLKFLRLVLSQPDVQQRGASFWVMPSREEGDRNVAWLRANGFHELDMDDTYVAPDYRGQWKRNDRGELADEDLAKAIEARRPRWVFLNVGSGVQEPLGDWLRKRLDGRPAIVCSGAAIAFLTGGQVDIPPWADRHYLGWLLRILRQPCTFIPRYFRALGLLPLMLRWGEGLPRPQNPRLYNSADGSERG